MITKWQAPWRNERRMGILLDLGEGESKSDPAGNPPSTVSEE
jgi:hypothetical protein